MPAFTEDRSAFARLVNALRPYLSDLVFVGGWAHRLLALHELASPLDFQTLMTTDIDVATPARLRARGPLIRDLLQQNGFKEKLSGDETPPISEYRLGEEEGALYVEFLAPQLGGPNRRAGSADATVDVSGITAQRLKYLEVLFAEPWSVQLNDANGYPLGKDGASVKVPNPAAYLMQKILVLPERKHRKPPKDVLYIHDTLLMFRGAFDKLRLSARMVAEKLHPKWVETFHERRRALFDAVDDRLRGAERIARESGRASPPSADQIRLVCRQGLDRVFGSVG